MIVPYTSCLAGNELFPTLTKKYGHMITIGGFYYTMKNNEVQWDNSVTGMGILEYRVYGQKQDPCAIL
jgi:hypothetical protein